MKKVERIKTVIVIVLLMAVQLVNAQVKKEGSNDPEKQFTIKKCVNCCLALGESHKDIETKLKKENLPLFDYRTSATFGNVRIARTSTSSVNDIFGATVNRCAKINRTAPANGLIIGEEFYENAKDLDSYTFKKIASDIVSPEHGYTGYIVYRKQK